MPGLARAQAAEIQLVVPAPGGSRTGYIGRILAQELGTALGRPVTTLNIDTAIDAYYYLSQAKADGSVIGLVAADIAILPHRSSSYANMSSLSPLALVATDPAGIHVRTEAPYATAEAVAAAVKAQPGSLKIAGAGAIWHLSTVRWLTANGMQPANMPWTNAESIGAAAGQLAAGQSDVLVCSIPEMRATPAGAKIKTVGQMSDRRNQRYPAIPIVGEKGPKVDAGIWRGLAAPKALPAPAATALIQGIKKAYAAPGFQQAMARRGILPALVEGSGFGTFADNETQAIGAAMKAAGLA